MPGRRLPGILAPGLDGSVLPREDDSRRTVLQLAERDADEETVTDPPVSGRVPSEVGSPRRRRGPIEEDVDRASGHQERDPVGTPGSDLPWDEIGWPLGTWITGTPGRPHSARGARESRSTRPPSGARRMFSSTWATGETSPPTSRTRTASSPGLPGPRDPRPASEMPELPRSRTAVVCSYSKLHSSHVAQCRTGVPEIDRCATGGYPPVERLDALWVVARGPVSRGGRHDDTRSRRLVREGSLEPFEYRPGTSRSPSGRCPGDPLRDLPHGRRHGRQRLGILPVSRWCPDTRRSASSRPSGPRSIGSRSASGSESGRCVDRA